MKKSKKKKDPVYTARCLSGFHIDGQPILQCALNKDHDGLHKNEGSAWSDEQDVRNRRNALKVRQNTTHLAVEEPENYTPSTSQPIAPPCKSTHHLGGGLFRWCSHLEGHAGLHKSTSGVTWGDSTALGYKKPKIRKPVVYEFKTLDLWDELDKGLFGSMSQRNQQIGELLSKESRDGWNYVGIVWPGVAIFRRRAQPSPTNATPTAPNTDQ